MRKLRFDFDFPVAKTILIVWIVFASLYVVYGEYQRLQNAVARAAYNQGLTTAVTQLISEAGKCQPIPITAGNVKVELIATQCLNGGAPKTAPAAQE